jgi:hypothetical protein
MCAAHFIPCKKLTPAFHIDGFGKCSASVKEGPMWHLTARWDTLSDETDCHRMFLRKHRSLIAGSSTRCSKTNSVAWVREGTIPTEPPPLVGGVSANFRG